MMSCYLHLAGWVNRFANAGDTAMEVAGTTAMKVYSFAQILINAFSLLFLIP